MKLQGIFIDTATPFDHAGNLYRVKIEHNIAKWNQTSVAGYVIGGFAGEGALLSAEEKTQLWKSAAACAAPDKVLIAGIDVAGVCEASALVNQAADAGFAVALVETPRSEQLMRSQEVQLLYFRAVADRARIPILVSNRPEETGVVVSTLLRHPNVLGVVDHSGERKGALCGSATKIWSGLTQGAPGAVLSFASAAPYAAIALWEAFRTREEEAGQEWQSRIAPAADLLSARYGIAGLKHAMDLNGYYGGPPRLPWSVVGPAARMEIERAFADLKS
jgi:4-hydroxy-2-oxoglutarate aldolase